MSSNPLPKVIYIMGTPGAGKGTQAILLSEKIGYHNFSTGNAFRKVAKQDTPLGRKVKETIDNGFLAPPEMAAEIVIEAVKEHVGSNTGLIFDGTPRTVEEARIVDDFFNREGYGQPLVIFLKVDKEEMIRRNSSRKFCLGVTSDFPVITPEDHHRCSTLGGTVGTRVDDEPEKFETRWSEFMDQTHPVIEEYKAQGMVHELDGMQPIDEVHAAIMSVIANYDRNA